MTKFRHLLRAILLPLAFLFGLVGTILMLFGAIELFKLQPESIQAAGLSKELSLYADCT